MGASRSGAPSPWFPPFPMVPADPNAPRPAASRRPLPESAARPSAPSAFVFSSSSSSAPAPLPPLPRRCRGARCPVSLGRSLAPRGPRPPARAGLLPPVKTPGAQGLAASAARPRGPPRPGLRILPRSPPPVSTVISRAPAPIRARRPACHWPRRIFRRPAAVPLPRPPRRGRPAAGGLRVPPPPSPALARGAGGVAGGDGRASGSAARLGGRREGGGARARARRVLARFAPDAAQRRLRPGRGGGRPGW